VTKTATLLRALKATVSKVMSAHMNHGKTSSVKRNSGRKSTLTERGRHILRRTVLKNHSTAAQVTTVLKNHSTAAQVTTELNIHLEDPVATKTVRHGLHKSNIHGKAAIAKPLITESNAQMYKQWCHNHKAWKSDNWKRLRDMVR
jgi:hypothetical protein